MLDGEQFTIGQLARRSGLPVRTIRFWSDSGLVPDAGRSAGGYRLYDAVAVVRLHLVHTLRELGLGLDTIRQILIGATTVAEVARTHAVALDAEIRTLRLRRAVLRAVARHGTSTEEMVLVHKLARLSAQQRQQIIDEFVDRTFAGTTPSASGQRIADSMRQLPADLPDDPTPEQVDAWIELADLINDQDFQDRVRQMALADVDLLGSGPAGHRPDTALPRKSAVMTHAGKALADGIAPDSPQGKLVLDRIVAADTPAAQQAQLLERLEMFTDARLERYLQLVAIINGRAPSPPRSAAFGWLVAALQANRP